MNCKYWCFICSKQFQLETQAEKVCPSCQQSAFQQITMESHPQQFQVYQPQVQPPPQTNNYQQNQQNPMIGLINIIQEGINSTIIQTNQNLQGNGNNMLGFQTAMNASIGFFTSRIHEITNLMQSLINSGQSYRNATQQQINALQRIKKPHDCAICQGQNETQDGYKLRCGHQYHVDCINEWFNRANTCPTCRSTL